jgi:hypothetical protein
MPIFPWVRYSANFHRGDRLGVPHGSYGTALFGCKLLESGILDHIIRIYGEKSLAWVNRRAINNYSITT